MRVLGFESSCDETGVALVELPAPGETGVPRLLAQALHSQISMHQAYGGVVPELASRDHIRRVLPLTRQVLADASATLVYERLVTRECEAGYKDMNFDQHWQNAPGYGCAVSSNMVQHVSDKQQFINPTVMGSAPAQPLVNTLSNAYRNQVKQQSNQDSYDVKSSTLGGGGGG